MAMRGWTGSALSSDPSKQLLSAADCEPRGPYHAGTDGSASGAVASEACALAGATTPAASTWATASTASVASTRTVLEDACP
eukprot:354470-Chlamydomonas_euryale.AAC.33